MYKIIHYTMYCTSNTMKIFEVKTNLLKSNFEA